MVKDFAFIQNMVDCLCGMEVHLVPSTQEGMMQLVSEVFRELVPTARSEQVLMRSLQALSPGCIYEISGALDLQYAVFCHGPTRQLLVLGPCRAGLHNETEIGDYLRRHQTGESRIRSLIAFYRRQPLVPYERLHSLAVLLAQQLIGTSEPVAFQRLEPNWHQEDRLEIMEAEGFEDLSQIRRIEDRYAASTAMTEAVKQGNLSMAYRLIQRMNSVPDELVRNEDHLRNAQNLCIVLNTQLRHAMEEVGVSPYRLDQVSGGIGRQIERLKTMAAAQAFFGEILQQYCQLAQERETQGLSAFGRLAVTYIQSHLSDNLTVKEAAKALLVNADYLSAQFHRDVGVPFIAYVNQQRVKQAAALLRRTEMQIQQIASAVGYNNTSYFAKQFVKYQGMTPREYRKGRS